MRVGTALRLMIFVMAATLMATDALHSQQFGKKGRPPGKGGGFTSMDPADIFERYSLGRPYFEIAQTKSLQEPLLRYAQEKGITNGQVTRQQFLDFFESYKKQMENGTLPPGGPPGGPPAGRPPLAPSPDTVNLMADEDFKKRDVNGDGKLNSDEMPGKLRDSLSKWDSNGDGLIDKTEYRAYYSARISDDGKTPNTPIPLEIIEEEEWDKRVTVLRAGKLPSKGLPDWFVKYDIDADGQVALWEWRKAGKHLDEFGEWDTDADGFITPHEAMKILVKKTSKGDSPGTGSMLSSADNGGRSMPGKDGGRPGRGGPPRPGEGPGAWSAGSGGFPWGGGGPSGFGGPPKKKGKS